jgi:hypothetical protein
LWRARFAGGICRPVIRQATEWMMSRFPAV